MENANKLKQKLQQGQFCLGVGIQTLSIGHCDIVSDK